MHQHLPKHPSAGEQQHKQHTQAEKQDGDSSVHAIQSPDVSSCTTPALTPPPFVAPLQWITLSRRLSLRGDSTTCWSEGIASSWRMQARVGGVAVAVRASTARGRSTLHRM
eukprot:GHUV01037884.1.p2 GENE.GHUV01037884.1~~GHUV01037884.1.p2  ORF type:complete len:111 (+),score=25.27 GHUV01037884.1:386-718(+)